MKAAVFVMNPDGGTLLVAEFEGETAVRLAVELAGRVAKGREDGTALVATDAEARRAHYLQTMTARPPSASLH